MHDAERIHGEQALMPVGLIAAIASLAGVGATVGQTVYSDMNQPSAPKAMAPPTPTPSQVITDETAKRAAVARAGSGASADILSRTGGSVSPDYTQQMADLLSGNGQYATPGAFASGGSQGGAFSGSSGGFGDSSSGTSSIPPELLAKISSSLTGDGAGVSF